MASTASLLATSPAAWPPIPSATTYSRRSSSRKNASSLSLRNWPTSVRPKDTTLRQGPDGLLVALGEGTTGTTADVLGEAAKGPHVQSLSPLCRRNALLSIRSPLVMVSLVARLRRRRVDAGGRCVTVPFDPFHPPGSTLLYTMRPAHGCPELLNDCHHARWARSAALAARSEVAECGRHRARFGRLCE